MGDIASFLVRFLQITGEFKEPQHKQSTRGAGAQGVIKLEMHRVSSDQEHDTNIEKVQSASKKRMEIDAGIGAKSYQEQVCQGPRRLLSLDQSRDNYNRHNSNRAWTWLEIHASLRLLNLPISLTPLVVPWAQFLVFWLFLLLPWPCSQPALLALSQVCIRFV